MDLDGNMAPVIINPVPGRLVLPFLPTLLAWDLHGWCSSGLIPWDRLHVGSEGAWTQDFCLPLNGNSSETAQGGHRTVGTGHRLGWAAELWQEVSGRHQNITSTGWGCLPHTLSLTWWCHCEQHVKKETGFPKEERGGKKNKSLKCFAAAEAGRALRRARCLVHPWWGRGQWVAWKHIPSP